MKTLSSDLQDRTLRFDGVSVVSPEMVARAIMLGVKPAELRVTGSTWEIDQLNANLPAEEEIKVAADEPVALSYRWKLPEPYLSMDLQAYIIDQASDWILANVEESSQMLAMARVAAELVEIEKRGMVEFIKTIIYVLATFRQKGIVWGVGRGSSCASYILFILGLHAVDCVKLDVPMEEFFHD